MPDRDRFGGWSAGPKLEATGFFRTQKVDGKWWLVTPDGHLFWSTGIDTMILGDFTLMEGDRKSMFTWLPEPGDPLYQHTSEHTWNFGGKSISGRWIDFYGVNLERKYGQDYEKAWRDMSLRRMRAWGFNTVGNWSGPLQPNDHIPYVATVWVGGGHKRVSGGWDYWGQMHDPFDPRFAADVADSVKEMAAEIKDDPMCLGYFVDNELSWSGWDGKRGPIALAYGALSLDAASSPAKKALVDDITAKYASVDDLNKAWGTSFSSWDDFGKPFVPKDEPNDTMAKDLDAYVYHFATQYFTVVRNALKAADPHHLYLGCRFAAFSPTIVAAAALVCDVVSFNVYAKTLDPARFGFLSKLDKPCIIGEFHFGALDRGMFSPGLVEAPDQAGRGRMYQAFVDSVLASPNFVGAHWFEYEDEPLTGRFDGENYQIGLVSVTDTPYPEMVKAAQAEHRSMYEKRYRR